MTRRTELTNHHRRALGLGLAVSVTAHAVVLGLGSFTLPGDGSDERASAGSLEQPVEVRAVQVVALADLDAAGGEAAVADSRSSAVPAAPTGVSLASLVADVRVGEGELPFASEARPAAALIDPGVPRPAARPMSTGTSLRELDEEHGALVVAEGKRKRSGGGGGISISIGVSGANCDIPALVNRRFPGRTVSGGGLRAGGFSGGIRLGR